MRILNADKKLGNEGESYSREIEFEVENELLDCDIYLEFEKPNGKLYVSERINPQEKYLIPYSLLDIAGFLSVQIVAYRDNKFIKKSSVEKFYISKSINAVESLLNDDENIGFIEELISISNKLGAKLLVNENGVISLLNKDNEVVSQIDLPTEKIIKNVYYDDSTKSLVFEFENANNVYVPMDISIDENTDLNIKNLTLKGKLNSNLTPEIDKAYNLGTKTNWWKNIFSKEINANKYRLDTGKIDEETGEPIFYTFAVYQDEQLKIQRDGSSVAQFGKGFFSISDGYHKIFEKQLANDDVRLNYGNGSKAINIARDSGQIEFYDTYGVKLMELNTNGIMSLWDANSYQIIDMEGARGGFNISYDNFDLIHENQINLIPNFDWEGQKGVKYVDVQSYDRIKIGGYEFVTLEGQENGDCPEVIFAYKPKNSEGEIVPFAITKDGRVYYQGSEIVTKDDLGNIEAILDRLNGEV